MNKRKGFVLLPDRRIMSEAIALSKQLEGNKLQLELITQLPHVTLLQTFFKPGFNYSAALKTLRKHRGFKSEPYTRLNGISTQHADAVKNITWWNLVNAKWLQELNAETVERYESEIVKPEKSKGQEFSNKDAEESFLRTGYSRNLKAYEPHITLGVSEKRPKELSSTLSGELVKFHRLAFVEHGDNGVISRIFDSVDLPISWD